ncbi:hypothetical protein CHUAL_004257 [Chamberlinius hualienensis]
MENRHYMFWIGFLLLMHFCGGRDINGKNKIISASLDAKWMSTPIILEISEYLAEENSNLFWDYVDRIAELDPAFLHKGSDRDYYELILNEASKLISPEKLKLLKFTLALRSYSPTVEMFQQIAANKGLPADCSAVIEVNSKFTCDPVELESLLENAYNTTQSDIYKLDHRYQKISVEYIPITVILYGELGTASFREFHFILMEQAKLGKFKYIIRHYVKPENRNLQKVRLSGYGVELAIKSTEYKAQDDTKVKSDESVKHEDDSGKVDEVEELEGFVFSRLKTLYPDLSSPLDKMRDQLLEESSDLAPLKVWQLKDLGMQAAQRIMAAPAEEALRVLRSTSQNFPLLARSLTTTTVNEEMRKEILKNQNIFTQHFSLSQNDAALFINGIFFDPDVSDIFTIFEAIREEQNLIEQLHKLGVQSDQMEKILSLDLSKPSKDYAVDIRDSAIRYLNDLESDRMYASWLSSINDILRPTYPGMLRSIRKNIFHLVAVVDPSLKVSRDLLKLLESFYVHSAPIRIGLIFTVNSDPSVIGLNDASIAMLNAFNFISEERGKLYKGLSFITDVYARIGDDTNPTSEDVINAFKSEFPSEDIDLIFGADSDYDTGRKLARDFMTRTGIKDVPTVFINGVRLPKEKLSADDFEEAVLLEIMEQTTVIQKAVYKGELSDRQSVIDFLMESDNVVPRLNDRVLSGSSNLIKVDGIAAMNPSIEKFSGISSADKTASIITGIQYITDKDNISFTPITVWVIADIASDRGRQLILNAIEQIKESNNLRIAIIYNLENTADENMNKISDAIQFALKSLKKRRSRKIIEEIFSLKNINDILTGQKSPLDILTKEEKELYNEWSKEHHEDLLSLHSIYCNEVLDFQKGQNGLVVNGKILGPFDPDEAFTAEDFSLLERHSLTTFGNKIQEVFSNLIHEGEQDSVSDLAFRVSALILGRPATRVRHKFKYHDDKHSVVKIPAQDPNSPSFNITAIVDPTSRGAQKLSHILIVLQDILNCHISVFLNAPEKVSEMPLKTFYRYVLEPEIQFTFDDKFATGPMARFQKLPTTALLTMHMDTPENWLVESVRTPYDLDNIHLEKLENDVYGEFELEHLLIEGHCFDQATGSPPRGLQFVLGTSNQPEMVDTIVMANLGYFQLKASAGAWILKLRNGRSADIYDIATHEGADSPSDSSDVHILIGNFRSHIVKIKVAKKPEKRKVDLLSEDDDESSSGIWNSIANTFSRSKNADDDSTGDDVINIFSLASGHLYERLLRIMMLSVLKHTKTPVKFWFLKNYLSPSFKDLLPFMAQRYGFQYELVQYKWPRWLHQQTEKQRIIWGYKILFLDVLFPLNVKKIIFVDADQVVRVDLKELRDFDLGGAPYGYTPFCEGRREMDGYRFWKSGYWASHLQGRKYHISALYVVDLKKFRRIAAGDRLRGQYQGLSQDPNSLSNLDQDLPNNMIHQVAIKSLPQDWLWCETWCETSTLSRAKTIDLCNNPQTKESKLSSAMRIIPEWKGYDEEIRQLMEQFASKKQSDNTSGIIKEDKHKTESSKHEEHTDL